MSFLKALFASVLGFFISLFLIVFIGVMMVIGIINSATQEQETFVETGSVLKIEPDGAIPEYIANESFSEITSGSADLTLGEYLDRIESAASDDRIKGIWLQLGNYGGNWAQASELRAKLSEFKKSGKFIYAFSDVNGWDEVNYYLASVADSVMMNPAAGMEFNGIYATLPFFRPMLERLGIKAEVVRAGSFKSAVEPFILDSASAESQMMVSQMVEGSFSVFTAAVRESRKLSEGQVQNILANNPAMTSAEARSLGLIDAVVYHDQVVDLLRSKTGKDKDSEPALVEIEDYIPSIQEGNSGTIAVVYAVGGIASGESRYNPNPLFGGETVGSTTFRESMREAREDDNVKVVIVRIDSPGGDAAASEEMWREIMLTREVKPVIASMAGVAASGGYYIAAPADTILAEPATITGSIGVFGMWFNMEQFWEDKIGVNTQVVKTNPYADMYSSARPATPEEMNLAGRQVDSVYKTFLSVVSQGRGLSMDSVMAIAQGRVWTGAQAHALGLVDILGGFDRAVTVAAERAGLQEGSYSLRILPRRKDFFETFSETFNSRVAAMFSTRTVIDDYQALIEAVELRSGVQARMSDVKFH